MRAGLPRKDTILQAAPGFQFRVCTKFGHIGEPRSCGIRVEPPAFAPILPKMAALLLGQYRQGGGRRRQLAEDLGCIDNDLVQVDARNVASHENRAPRWNLIAAEIEP